MFDVELSNLTAFIKADDNARIKSSSDDRVINKLASIIAGVVVMILIQDGCMLLQKEKMYAERQMYL